MNPELTPEVRALLEAVRDAVNLPHPGLEDADERAYRRVVAERASTVRIVLQGVLDDGHGLAGATEYLTERTAQTPAKYTPYVQDESTDR